MPQAEIVCHENFYSIMTASIDGNTVIDDGGNVSDLPGDEIGGDAKERKQWSLQDLW